MPVVQYERQVEQSAFRAPDVADRTQGFDSPAVDRAQERFTAGVGGIMEQEKQRADDTIAKDAINKIISLKNDLAHNTQSGWTTVMGQNALKPNIMDDYNKRLEDGFKEIDKGLHNRTQRDIVERAKAVARLEQNEGMQRHIFQQGRIVEKQTDIVSLNTSKEDAILNWGNDSVRARSEALIDGIYGSQVQRGLLTPEAGAVSAHADKSAMYRGIVDSMTGVSGNYERANQFVGEIESKKGFTSNDLEYVKKVLNVSGLDDKSLALSRDIIDKAGTDLTAQKKALAGITDAKLHDRVASRLSHYNAAEKDRLQQVSDYRVNSAAKYIQDFRNERVQLRQQGYHDFMAGVDPYEALPAPMKANITNDEMKKIRGLVDPPHEDNPKVMTYLNRLQIEDPVAFIKEDPLQYVGDMSPASWKSYLNDRERVAANDERTQTHLAKLTADSVALNNVMNEAGLKPKVPRSAEYKARWDKYDALENEVKQELRVWAKGQGEEPDPQAQEAFMRSLVQPYTVRPDFLDPDKPAFDKVKPLIQVEYKDIPRDERQKIFMILSKASNGQSIPTNQQILNYFIRSRARAVGRSK